MQPQALRKIVSGWPGVTEDVKWGQDLVFSVGGKMFCVTDAAGAGGLSFKVEPERFLELIDRPGVVPAPYLARAHWVQLADLTAMPAAELQALLRQSYELVRAGLTRRLQAEFAD